MFLQRLQRFLERRKAQKILSRENLKKLEALLGRRVNNPGLYIEALTHRSALTQQKLARSNERLEFLGDAVLGFVIAEELYSRFPKEDEGFLTKVRANLVNKNTLFTIGKRIGLFELLIITDDLITSESFGVKTVLADAFEALIGAVYLDGGLEPAKGFIKEHLLDPALTAGLHLQDDNFKSKLLELTQSLKLGVPKYNVIREEGPEHDRLFFVEVQIGDSSMGIGQGRNKKSAEQDAAKHALQKSEGIRQIGPKRN